MGAVDTRGWRRGRIWRFPVSECISGLRPQRFESMTANHCSNAEMGCSMQSHRKNHHYEIHPSLRPFSLFNSPILPYYSCSLSIYALGRSCYHHYENLGNWEVDSFFPLMFVSLPSYLSSFFSLLLYSLSADLASTSSTLRLSF